MGGWTWERGRSDPAPFRVGWKCYLGAMSELDTRIDEIVKALVRDVAAGVHGLYRGDTRQQTTQLKLSTYGKDAAERIRAAIRGQVGTPAAGVGMAAPIGAAPVGAVPEGAAGAYGIGGPPQAFGVGGHAPPSLTQEEVGALTRCVMAWLPLGGNPNAATPEMKCVAGAREMSPTWGDRETARLALRRIASGT